MKLHIIAVGTRVPGWINQGVAEYRKRFSPQCSLEVKSVSMVSRSPGVDIAKLKDREATSLLAAVPKGSMVIALDENGKTISTMLLAQELKRWLHQEKHVAFLIGGPDGLHDRLTSSVDEVWSLSPLTLPHAMVRVVLAEQLYRAWSIVVGTPYHRA